MAQLFNLIIYALILLLCLKTPFAYILSGEMVNYIAFIFIVIGIVLIALYDISKVKKAWAINVLILILLIKFLLERIYTTEISLNYALISFIPKLALLLILLLLYCLPYNCIVNGYSFLRKIMLLSLVCATFEMMIPDDIFLNLVLAVQKGKNPLVGNVDAYSDTIFGIKRMRIGSFYFEPITFGMISAFVLFREYFSKNKNYFYVCAAFLCVILSGAKSALMFILIGTFFVAASFGKSLFVSIFLLLAVVYNSSPLSVLSNGELTPGIESITNHILGLFFGVFNSLKEPIVGFGYGTAGYLVFLKSLDNFGYDPFKNDYLVFAPLENGNESAIGVLFYEFGFALSVLVLVYTLIFAKKNHHNSNKAKSGMIVGYVLFAMLSESALSIAIFFAFALTYFSFHRDNIYSTN